jgi:subtilase family serine protease
MRTRGLQIAGGLAVCTAAALWSGCAGGIGRTAVPSSPAGAARSNAGAAEVISSPGFASVRRACPETDPDVPHCEAVVRTDGASNNGYLPSDLQAAYNLPSTTAGSGQTVALVELLDDPNVEADLFYYRNTFNLPVCSTLNGCFTRVNENGKAGDYPPASQDAAIETSVDLDMVSAVCPNCKVILVEGKSDTWKSLGASVDEAVNLGANIVSVSYGGSSKKVDPSDYDHKGVVILAAGGDDGYLGHRDQEPADFPTVVAVGGTSLTRNSGTGSGRGWTEIVWSGTGSGCSSFAKPSWQHDPGCSGRTANDISAVADPATGVAVYDTYQESGWMQIGGTSVSTPLNASVFALAGNAARQNAAETFYKKAHHQYLNDITSGFNGGCPRRYQYLCTGEPGYNGPSGWGTPNGIAAY